MSKFKTKIPTTQAPVSSVPELEAPAPAATSKKVGRPTEKNLKENYTKINAYIPKELYEKMKMYRSAAGYSSMTEYIETVLQQDMDKNEDNYKTIFDLQNNR